MKRYKLISKIWDNLQMDNVFETNEEKVRIIGDIYKCAEILKSTIRKEDISVFSRFGDLLSEYCKISEEDAFASGIRFATEYLLEAENNEYK